MLKRVLLAAVAALSLTACAEQQPTVWYKPGATQQSFAGDELYCMERGRAAGGSTTVYMYGVAQRRPNVDDRTYKLCMVSRGYGTEPINK